MRSTETLQDIARLVRHHIITSTTAAGSGHPTSSLSAADLMTVLMFDGFFSANLDNPANPENDRLIFSKGHAAPLLYSLYTVLGKISYEKLLTLRQFYSTLEGHPTMRWEYTEAATGSLGQGLGVGLGMALAAQIDNKDYKTFVLLGDSEMAEGSVWEAMMVAANYKAKNLVAIVDINRLGQRGETMFGHDLENYKAKCEAFGWETWTVDGHDINAIQHAFAQIKDSTSAKPKVILAETLKGKGISFIEDKDGWHGKALSQEESVKALKELGTINPQQVYSLK
jgi:transketolase